MFNNIKPFTLIFFTIFIISCSSKAPDTLKDPGTSYLNWQKEAKDDMRLLPKYGNTPKNDQYKEADAELLKSVKNTFGSLDSASKYYFLKGCDYLNRGDLKTAMFRFNQAWLMNPKNPDVFRGFGYVYTRLDQHVIALKLYNEGLTIDPKNEDLLLEKTFATKELQK